METIKEIYDAYSQRIRSPFFGYIIIAFIIINWKAIFFLLFSDEPILTRFSYIDQTTGFWRSVFFPIISGVSAALAKPYLSLWGAMWADWPVNKQKLNEAKASSDVAEYKEILLEQKKRKIEEIISTAQQDEEIEKIQDDEVREQVKDQVENVRKSGDIIFIDEPKKTNSDLIKELEKKVAELSFLTKTGETQAALDQLNEVRGIVSQLSDNNILDANYRVEIENIMIGIANNVKKGKHITSGEYADRLTLAIQQLF